jgi:hypothetical protein
MKRVILSAILALLLQFAATSPTHAQTGPVDTVKVGIYITSIHDIDFKKEEYSIAFWLWLTYKNRDFDFMNNLEIPLAKTESRAFATIDTSGKNVFIMMKIQCVMKDSWKIGSFPFDKQKLRLSIENSQYDNRSLVFVPDPSGKHFDPRFTLSDWSIDSCEVFVAKKIYDTNFGDTTLPTPRSVYSSFRVRLDISRDATGLFWKMFLGMYIAFMIAYVCFYIHSDGIDSRFGLSVGSLFAVIGNKYIIDSALPESTSFTLVDTLHGLTLFFIFAIISATTYSFKMVKENRLKEAHRFDMITAQVMLVAYIILNIYFIHGAMNG